MLHSVPEHEQVQLPSRPDVTVDAGMLVLCEYLNAHGWTTVSSCQGRAGTGPADPGSPYVSFAPVAGIEPATAAMADLARAAGEAQLAARVLGVHVAPFGESPNRWVRTEGQQWRYTLAWFRTPDWAEGARHGLAASIRMSHDDLGAISALVRKAGSPHPVNGPLGSFTT